MDAHFSKSRCICPARASRVVRCCFGASACGSPQSGASPTLAAPPHPMRAANTPAPPGPTSIGPALAVSIRQQAVALSLADRISLPLLCTCALRPHPPSSHSWRDLQLTAHTRRRLDKHPRRTRAEVRAALPPGRCSLSGSVQKHPAALGHTALRSQALHRRPCSGAGTAATNPLLPPRRRLPAGGRRSSLSPVLFAR